MEIDFDATAYYVVDEATPGTRTAARTFAGDFITGDYSSQTLASEPTTDPILPTDVTIQYSTGAMTKGLTFNGPANSYVEVGEKYILGGENLNFKDFLDMISEIGNVPKVNIQINFKYLIPLAFLNEFLCNFFISRNPSLTIDSLKMSSKKMFFSSMKAKKKLGYRPRPAKNAIKDAINWMNTYFT